MSETYGDPGTDPHRAQLFGRGQLDSGGGDPDQGAPVMSKARKAGRFAPFVVNVPLIGGQAVQIAERNPRRIALWIWVNFPQYGVYIGPSTMAVPPGSGVPASLGGADVGFPLAGYQYVTIDDCFDAIYVASNIAAGTPQLVVVDLAE